MKTFPALLAICAGNSPVTGEFPTQRPVTRSFDVFFDLRVNKRLSKQSWGWWFETPSCPLRQHSNDLGKIESNSYVGGPRSYLICIYGAMGPHQYTLGDHYLSIVLYQLTHLRIYGACSAPSLYLNQCWLIVNWTIRNKLQWNSNQNKRNVIHENAFEYVVCEMAVISKSPWYQTSDNSSIF